MPNNIKISGKLPFINVAVVEEISKTVDVGICIFYKLATFWNKSDNLFDNVKCQRYANGYQKIRENIIKYRA